MTMIYFALFYLFIVTNKAKVFRVCELYYELKHLGMDPFKGIYSEECEFYLLGMQLTIAILV